MERILALTLEGNIINIIEKNVMQIANYENIPICLTDRVKWKWNTKDNNTIQISIILQNRITVYQGRVKMEAFVIIPQLDTHAAARMITLGTTAIVSIILLCTYKYIYSHNLRRILNLAIPNVISY